MGRFLLVFVAALAQLCFLGISPQAARADLSGQFYFTAVMAPPSSITGTAGQPNTVYLRWDTIEGDLPADVTGFEIERDGSSLVSIPLAPMSVAEIEALYTAPDQARRRAETIAWLDRESPPVDGANFASAIHAKLVGDPQLNALWLGFGSRLDFNIAQARRRGFRDDTAPAGSVTYELLATRTAPATSIRIGLLILDTTQTHLVPEAAGLSQIELSRCDAPELGKDHSSVALGWAIPEQNVDQYRNALVTAGWDIWRRTDCSSADPAWVATDPPPVVNLRSLMSTAPYGAEGNPVLSGYERVNDQPVVVSGGAPDETEERYKGFNSPYAQYYEPMEQIEAAGLVPGVSCPYYVVPRDVTGGYGETASLMVTVPDLERPPAPWVVETLTDTMNATLDITFDHVNVENYYDDHQRDRTYCNLDTARFDKELRYVQEGESCDTGAQRRVKLDVVGYLAYRFRQPEDARNFEDTDGDGHGDQDERDTSVQSAEPGFEALTLPGSACDPSTTAGPYWRVDPKAQGLPYTIDADDPSDVALVQRDDGRWSIEFADNLSLLTETENTYFYRFASVHEDGSISELSEPVRGLYHQVDPPSREEIDCNYGELVCDYGFEQVVGQSVPLFAEDMSEERVSAWVRLSCYGSGSAASDPTWQQYLSMGEYDFPAFGQLWGSELPAGTCEDVALSCGGSDVVAEFLNDNGEVLAEGSLSGGAFSECAEYGSPPAIRLTEDCQEISVRPHGRGTTRTARGPFGLECPEVDGCFRLFREAGGHNFPLATVCEDDLPICFDGFLVNNNGVFEVAECPSGFNTQVNLPNLSGEPMCISVALVDENNLSSSKFRLDCLQSASPPPGPPQPLQFKFDAGSNTGSISWLPPQQPVLGTLVEFYRSDTPEGEDPFRTTTFFEHPNRTAYDGPIEQAVMLDDPIDLSDPDWEEEWCFRARTIGRAGTGDEKEAVSPWVGPRCGIRTALGEEIPEYLPWPRIESVPQGESLAALYLAADGLPVIHLTPAPSCATRSCDAPGEACLDLEAQAEPPSDCLGLCDALEAAIAGQVGFVAYRQERGPGVPATPFYQVSSYVPGLFCTETINYSGVDFSTLADPLIFYDALPALGLPWSDSSLFFVDRYPHSVDYEYRYQFVYFDDRGEITRYRTSNWVQAVDWP